MKYLFTILVAGICLVSCSSNEDNTENKDSDPLVKQMKFDGSNPVLTDNYQNLNFNFEYDNQKRLTKKVGGYMAIASGTGYSRAYTDKVFTSLIYTNNKVTVENFYSGIYTIDKNTSYYTLNSSNQIEEKEKPNNSLYQSKKLFYKYSNGKLIEIVTTYPNMPYDPNEETDYILTYSEKFYYDDNENLFKTEYFEQHNGKNEGEKIVRTFEDYDKSYNPFKRFQLLEEYFYRSLSRNNFRRYTETSDYYGNSREVEANWEFTYDTKGNIVLN